MYSMTGYGRASVERDGRALTIELKSVNHRFLDIAFRMPRSFSFMEDDSKWHGQAPNEEEWTKAIADVQKGRVL